MDQKAVAELGESAIAVSVDPLRRERVEDAPVLGFDTEYTSKGHSLLCFQLAVGETGRLIEARELSIDLLAREAKRMIPQRSKRVILAAYFSIAELQHLPVIAEAVEVRPLGASIDVDFYSRKHDLLLTIFDLARFFGHLPLSQVAKSYGLAKGEGVNRAAVTRRSLRSKLFRAYAIQDAILCAQIAAKLREGFAPDRVDPVREKTPASSAAAAFRLRLKSRLAPPPPRRRLMGLLCTWGGRAEALERGTFKLLHEYDLSSAYPRAAVSLGQLPRGRDLRPFDRISQTRKLIGGFGRVRFRFPPEELYPCLPVWTKRCQVYPLTGETYCTLDEMRTAAEMGARLDIVEGYGFARGDSLLPSFMSDLLTEREACSDPVRRTALKLLANSLIGKFAQRTLAPDMRELLRVARRKGLDLDGLVQITLDEARALGVPMRIRIGSAFFPEWNALITGRVRAIMGAAVRETRAVYASTDAVWTRSKEAPTPILGGRWERVLSGRAVVVRTRLARLGKHVAHHSIWKRSAGEDLLQLFESNPDARLCYRIERPIKFSESLRKGLHYGQWIEEEREADARWDYKRELRGSSGGASISSPWPSAADYLAATAEAHKTARATGKNKSRRG